jgi:hypothetical protein
MTISSVIFPRDLKCKTNDEINQITPIKTVNGLILATTRSLDYTNKTDQPPRYIVRTPKWLYYVLDVEDMFVAPRDRLAETKTNKGYHYLLPVTWRNVYHINKLQDAKYEAMSGEYYDEFTHDKNNGKLRTMMCLDWSCKHHVETWNELATLAESLRNSKTFSLWGEPCL